ncbi:hypothetical protein AB0F81_09580 [Actinoplanes sp. NPDC024001]|uniref:hypothetical protein n=1 Tax=Actinoplanes sp. NPDC024001 TaxID=3154598 RepID=UPI0034045A4C
MSFTVVVLLLLAGLSESAGRVLPVVARRSGASRGGAIGLMLFGAVVEATVFAVWPLLAWTLAGSAGPPLTWTPGLIAPLLLAAILAFPLLGPALHLLLLIGVGVGLAGALESEAAGWWVAVAGVGLALTVEGVRRLVGRVTRIAVPEPLT